MSKYSSWNKIPQLVPEQIVQVKHRLDALGLKSTSSMTPYGNGRSYGDVCLTKNGTLLVTRGMDRFIEFSPETGRLKCEAGITLGEILSVIIPQGWFLPVTPGTQFVTVGGAVANDVHGKNHHTNGSFGNHILSLDIWRTNSGLQSCSSQNNSKLFAATIGGLGLTGLILSVEFQLQPIKNPWMWVESQRFSCLDEFWNINQQAEQNSPYTVAWIDCTATGKSQGRGIYFSGQHAATQITQSTFRESRRNIPFELPFSLVNRLSLTAFNALYSRQKVNPLGQLSHYVPYFYPLDGVKNWNNIYGSKGFYQYQSVIPPDTAPDATKEMLSVISKYKQGSFLAVLKTFGNIKSIGMMSFSRPGVTLALDFPNLGSDTLALMNELDRIVMDAGGALYPGKDARMSAAMFKFGYPNWEEFSQYLDPQFSSGFWQRVSS